jgi:hypothetical protein
MMLGLVSFIVSVIIAAFPKLSLNRWLGNFMICSLIIYFVAFAFVTPSLSASYGINSSRQHLKAVRASSLQLIDYFNKIKTDIQSHSFQYIDYLLRIFSIQLEFWDGVEFKLAKELFYHIH